MTHCNKSHFLEKVSESFVRFVLRRAARPPGRTYLGSLGVLSPASQIMIYTTRHRTNYDLCLSSHSGVPWNPLQFLGTSTVLYGQAFIEYTLSSPMFLINGQYTAGLVYESARIRSSVLQTRQVGVADSLWLPFIHSRALICAEDRHTSLGCLRITYETEGRSEPRNHDQVVEDDHEILTSAIHLCQATNTRLSIWLLEQFTQMNVMSQSLQLSRVSTNASLFIC